jgi:hypothetical protein
VASHYCGTGGCELAVLVAKRDGSLVNVFSDPVREYEVLPGRGARTIRFWLHGSYCGHTGNPSCPREHRVANKPFAFKQPK